VEKLEKKKIGLVESLETERRGCVCSMPHAVKGREMRARERIYLRPVEKKEVKGGSKIKGLVGK
jgi:hypothetical protein